MAKATRILTAGLMAILMAIGWAVLTSGTAMAGQLTTLVKDIWPGANGSKPGETLTSGLNRAVLNGVLLFPADDGVHGIELWRSDGTAAGTTLLKDIAPGPGFSNPTYLTNVNGTVYFMASVGSGLELWKTDGTAAGTLLVKDINPGPGSGLSPAGPEVTSSNGIVFFRASDGVHGFELWRTDGSAAGTQMLKDINPGATRFPAL